MISKRTRTIINFMKSIDH